MDSTEIPIYFLFYFTLSLLSLYIEWQLSGKSIIDWCLENHVESTSSIMDRVSQFLSQFTSVIVPHTLSTVLCCYF